MSFSLVLQTAVFERLNAYTPLTAMATVRENIRQRTDYPYVRIGEDVLGEWAGDDFSGYLGSIVVHVWSREHNMSECKTLQGHVRDALHRYELTLTGYTLIGIEWASERCFRDPDGVSRHGVTEFSITAL